ncbi:hypothetical protein FZEAL_4600 [Fusarium zealandicum]|uniref:Dynamin N-terminal domain-containing protein n=1 Tax=Fusarium zealandicum TaxID=1053134 RepID=A0A8H4UM52_9HYPO|nr:hypothetical protein FZEAL_4600 [Fusarium zealandicum]
MDTPNFASQSGAKRERSPSNESSPAKRQAVELPATESRPSVPAWSRCKHLDDAQRLATKERALVRAEENCGRLAERLLSAAKDTQGRPGDSAEVIGEEIIMKWCKEYETICENHRNYGVRVGVEGPTGAGKSSFLGSLLRIEELLPSSQEAAATAVVAEVSWNYNDTPGYELCAEIRFRELVDVRDDLALLLTEMRNLKILEYLEFETSEDREEAIANANTIVKYELPKATAIWGMQRPALCKYANKCTNKVATQAVVSEILNKNSAVSELLNSRIKYLHSSDHRAFSRAIRPYLDSTKGLHGGSIKFSAWPLVDKVDIFVKSEILKAGIRLVDLPGCGDAMDSRDRIAQGFRDQLDIRMVVSPIYRAADEKNSRDLMQNGFRQLQLRMSGQLGPNSFCAILSKMDEITVNSYINGTEGLQDDEETLEKLTRSKELTEMKANIEKGSKAGKSRFQNVQSAATGQGDRTRDINMNLQVSEAIELATGAALTDATKAIQAQDGQEKQVALEIDRLKNWLHHKASETRNSRVKERIHDNFLTLQDEIDVDGDGLNADEVSWLPAFPVSSRAFWELEMGDDPMVGFPTQRFTGIPAVERWLHESTLSSREKHLDLMLGRYRNLMGRMSTYSQAQNPDQNFRFTRTQVELALFSSHKTFLQRINDMFATYAHEIKTMDPLAERKRSAITRFSKDSRKIVERWIYKYPEDECRVEKLAWRTHEAILRRGGNVFTSNGQTTITYAWLEELQVPGTPILTFHQADRLRASSILKSIVGVWDATINQKLPNLRKPILEKLKAIWGDYMDDLASAIQNFAPQLVAEFDKILPIMRREKYVIAGEIGMTLDRLSEKAGAGSSRIVPLMEEQLKPTFRVALDITGTGALKARHEIITRQVKSDMEPICRGVLKGLSCELHKHKSSIPGELKTIAGMARHNVESQITTLLNNLLDNDGIDTTTQGRKEQLQADVRDILSQWEIDWSSYVDGSEHILGRESGIPESIDDFFK